MARAKKKFCVLVEDDNEHAHIFEDSIKRIYGEDSISLLRFADGESAIQFLTNQSGNPEFEIPSVVVIDLNLPKVDGFEVIQTLTAHALYLSVPLVVLTSSGADRDISRAYQLGASGYMVKPLEIFEFRDMLKNFFSYWLTYNRGPDVAQVRS